MNVLRTRRGRAGLGRDHLEGRDAAVEAARGGEGGDGLAAGGDHLESG